MTTIAERLARVQTEVSSLRGDKQVAIIAVSKTHSAEMIQEAYNAGQRDFGENYIQEAVAKMRELHNIDIVWHFIGHLQSNKARLASENFSWVQSVHSMKLARKLSEFRSPSAAPLNITVQINISEEESKSGIILAEAKDFCCQVKDLPNLRLRGLMAISENTDSKTKQKELFNKMNQEFQSIGAQIASPFWDTLSMGMSSDMKSALAEGASMLRIGSAIFGPRHQAQG